jgi:hypothetical protein
MKVFRDLKERGLPPRLQVANGGPPSDPPFDSLKLDNRPGPA